MQASGEAVTVARHGGLGDWGRSRAQEGIREGAPLLPVLTATEAADVAQVLEAAGEVAAEPGRTRIIELSARLRARIGQERG